MENILTILIKLQFVYGYCIPEPNAVMFINSKVAKPSVFDVTKKTWSNEDFDGWVSNTNSI